MKILGYNISRDGNSAVKNFAVAELDEFLRWKIDTARGATGDDMTADVYRLYRSVPWLGRGVQLIAQAIHDFPFEIQNDAGEIVDSSKDWKNTLGFTGVDFSHKLWKVSSALQLRGRAYLFPERNRIKTKSLKYFHPDSIKPRITPQDGLIEFKRRFGADELTLQPIELIYFWLPDPQVEIGPPLMYPGQLAVSASGVLFSLDNFFNEALQRGLLKAFIALLKGLPPAGSEQGKAERERKEEEFERLLSGTRNANKVRVFQAEAGQILEVGGGLQELQNVELTNDKREDISVALGIPMSILWSSEAAGLGGGGVTKEDTYRFYTQTVMPHFDFIADILNQQLLFDLGYKIVPLPESLGALQEDENQRAAAFATYVNAGMDKRIVVAMLGISIPDEVKDIWDAQSATSDAARERLQSMPAPANQPPMIDVTPKPPQLPPGESAEQKRFREQLTNDLAKWQRKVENRLRAGKSAACEFSSDIIPPALRSNIETALKSIARDFSRCLMLTNMNEDEKERVHMIDESKYIRDILNTRLPTTLAFIWTPQDLEQTLAQFNPQDTLLFNWCEDLPGWADGGELATDIIERAGFAHTASPASTQRIVFDRAQTYLLLRQMGILIPNFALVPSLPCDALDNFPHYPVIVRPNAKHGSEGMKVCGDAEAARLACMEIFAKFGGQALIVEFIGDPVNKQSVREFSVGLWSDGVKIETMPILERDFSKDANTVEGEADKAPDSPHTGASNIVPAQLPPAIESKMVAQSTEIFKRFSIKIYGRVDWRLATGANDAVCVDVNPEPDISGLGVTGEPDSTMFAMVSKGLGMTHEQLILGIFDRALTYYRALDNAASMAQVKSIFARTQSESHGALAASPFRAIHSRALKANPPLIPDEVRRKAEAELRDKIAKLLRRKQDDAIEQIQRGERVDLADFQNEIAITIENELTANAAGELARLGMEVGFEFDPTAYDQAAREWAKQYSYTLVKDLTDNTRRVLQNAIEKFTAAQGMTRGDLQGLLRPAFGDGRADMIGVTELTRSYGQAQQIYKQMLADEGITMERQFHTNRDDIVCDVCRSLDNRIENERGLFHSDVSGQDYEGEPIHPGCRCGCGLRLKRK